jgi:hypothetical protein
MALAQSVTQAACWDQPRGALTICGTPKRRDGPQALASGRHQASLFVWGYLSDRLLAFSASPIKQ